MENNKLIAEFMGFKIWPEDDTKYVIPHFFNDAHNPIVGYNNKKAVFIVFVAADKLEFNSSWDWLMCVIEKIEELEDIDEDVTWEHFVTPIESCYINVVRYIKDHNDEDET